MNLKLSNFISGGVQLAGNEFPNAPEITAAFGGTYYFCDDFIFGIDASYTDGSFWDVQNTDDTSNQSRFLTNASLSYETEF